jgi:hypothetical protein
MEGTVVRWDGRTRIVLEIGILGRGASMEIDADLLEPAGDETDTAARHRVAVAV